MALKDGLSKCAELVVVNYTNNLGAKGMAQNTHKATRHQHYVPRAYLRQWCLRGEELAVGTPDKIIAAKSTKSFGAEHDMYAFVDLQPEELRFLLKTVKQIVDLRHPIVDALVVPIFLVVLFFRTDKKDWNAEYAEAYDEFARLPLSVNRVSAYKTLRSVAETNADLPPDVIEKLRNSFASGFEAFESQIENQAWEILKRVRNHDLGCLKNDSDLLRLLTYLVNQCFRGPDYIEMIREELPPSISADGGTPELANYMRYIQPLWVANNLVKTRRERKVVVLDNKTDLEFITTDTPYAIYGDARERKTPLITYFPLGPRQALFFGYSSAVNKLVTQKYGREIVDRNFVDWLNREVLASARRFVFATTSEVLIRNNYYISQSSKPTMVYGLKNSCQNSINLKGVL